MHIHTRAQERKTVSIEQLATEFRLRSVDVIDRIRGLEDMGRLTGVMDDRGKVRVCACVCVCDYVCVCLV